MLKSSVSSAHKRFLFISLFLFVFKFETLVIVFNHRINKIINTKREQITSLTFPRYLQTPNCPKRVKAHAIWREPSTLLLTVSSNLQIFGNKNQSGRFTICLFLNLRYVTIRSLFRGFNIIYYTFIHSDCICKYRKKNDKFQTFRLIFHFLARNLAKTRRQATIYARKIIPKF